MKGTRSFTWRLTLALASLLLVFGMLVAVLGRYVVQQHEQESLQRLSHGLARHIVEHWPQIAAPDRDAADRAEREALLAMLMVVNPGVQVYRLDADGRVTDYLGEPGMVRQHQIDLNAVRAFLGGAALPLRGTDPMGSDRLRLFSAAMFAPRAGDARPPGYLYVVLDGAPRQQVDAQISDSRAWIGAATVVLVGVLTTLGIGIFTFRRMTLPLRRLDRQMRGYSAPAGVDGPSERAAANAAHPGGSDEVKALVNAFSGMTQRIEAQAAREREQTAAHRESMAGIAHDLRSPLTALHGHLEALDRVMPAAAGPHERLLGAALAQSDRVRRLSQQLFELAALQSGDQVVQRDCFRLDELVTDAVQKFSLAGAPAPVCLSGPAPGRLELVGDMQLVERALSNLIDNALRHAAGPGPVRVSLQRDGPAAQIVVEDGGPGLPAELHQRLAAGQSLRDPPLRRSSGGIGGLGLAIAQRVAVLHGGSLLPLPAPQGGTRLCLALPLAG
jgi:signal transduction histidine kinase